MSETCETVKIKADNDQGFIIKNKSDLTKLDVIHKEKPEKKSEKKSKDKKSDKK